MNLKYLVIKCNDIEESKIFYEAIGFELTKEKHGEGLEHYSFKLNDITIELYPTKKRVEGNLILGLEIEISVLEIQKKLSAISYSKEFIKNKDGSVSILDPNGNKIIFC